MLIEHQHIFIAIGQVHIVDQQADANAPLGGLPQQGRKQMPYQIIMIKVILNIKASLRPPD